MLYYALVVYVAFWAQHVSTSFSVEFPHPPIPYIEWVLGLTSKEIAPVRFLGQKGSLVYQNA